MKREDQERLLGEFWASGAKRVVADATFRDWDDKANDLMYKILDEMAPSSAVKRLVEAVDAYFGSCRNRERKKAEIEAALIAVREETGGTKVPKGIDPGGEYQYAPDAK